MKALLEGLKALGPARLAAMGAVALGMLGLLALLTMRGSGDRMALLYADLDLRESAQIVEQLTHQHVSYQLAAGGTQILVPVDQVPRARLLLAKEGLPSGGSVGYEIFDRNDGLTATQFQQTINRTRALEGELARTIRAMDGVRAVRVHLVLPQREPFARDKQDAQASVLLTMAGAARLDREGVQAIVNLVAAAVPGLRPYNVTIVDSHGTVLARAGEPTGPAMTAQTTEELRHATELRLSRAVEDMLEKALGPGRVRAEAAVEMNFDSLHETQEHFDPDGQVTRSTQTVTDNTKSTEATSTVTVQNNLPNADAGSNPAGNQEQRQEETTNYEISKTVRTLIREQPQINRISLAVMVDGTQTVGKDGKASWQPLPADELAHITNLVKSAIGFNEKRGDHVEVVSMRFASGDEPVASEPRALFGLPLERADIMHLAQTALLGAIAVLALLFVLRPMVTRLTALQPSPLPSSQTAALLGGPASLPPALAALGSSIASDGGTGFGSMPLLEDESMVRVANIEGQLRASSIRRLTDLVEKHPEDCLLIVRGWMAQEAT